MNGQPTQTREYHVVGPGRQQFHKRVTYGEGHVPTQEGFDQMTQVIEGCLDKIQRGLKQLEKELSNPDSLILKDLLETIDRASVHDSLRLARLLTAGAVTAPTPENPSELLRGIFLFPKTTVNYGCINRFLDRKAKKLRNAP